MAVKEYSLKRDGEKSLAPHFKVREFRCQDGSDRILINEQLPTLLEALREKLGSDSIVITSGYRTEQHNAAVGGAKGSQHQKGNAADIRCKKSGEIIPAKEVCCALEDMGHTGGIGYISATAVHVDVRGYKSWFDETNGKTGIGSFYEYFGLKKPEPPEKENTGTITVGSIVTVKQGATSYEGKKIASFVYGREYRVDELSGNRAVLDKAGLCTAFRTKDLTLVGEASEPEGKTYTVKKGDSFWKIAAEQLGNGTRYKELAAFNGLDVTDTIYAGQTLKLPE